MAKEWHVIGRGFAGWHATGVNVSSSGGNLDPYTYWTGEKCKGYAQEAIEGALVYDAKHLEMDNVASSAFITLVMRGPMCDPSLPVNGFNKFGEEDRKAALRMMPGMSGGFAKLAKAAQNVGFSGLDKVGVGIYEEMLRKVPGIKIGHVRNGVVVWENE